MLRSIRMFLQIWPSDNIRQSEHEWFRCVFKEWFVDDDVSSPSSFRSLALITPHTKALRRPYLTRTPAFFGCLIPESETVLITLWETNPIWIGGINPFCCDCNTVIKPLRKKKKKVLMMTGLHHNKQRLDCTATCFSPTFKKKTQLNHYNSLNWNNRNF